MRIRCSMLVLLTMAALALLPAAAPEPAGAQTADTLILQVEGMWEEGCEQFVEEVLLRDLQGVGEIHADHESDVVTIDFDPARVSPERIAAAIEDCQHFDVVGSSTHALDQALIEESRRTRCNVDRRHRMRHREG